MSAYYWHPRAIIKVPGINCGLTLQEHKIRLAICNTRLPILSTMRFTSPTLLSVFVITFVSAIPAPDKYKHFKDPGCPSVGASSCLLVDYCNHHRKLGDLFTSRGPYLKRRDAHKPGILGFNLTDALSPSLPSSFTTRELDINRKRAGHSTQCGPLSNVIGNDISDQITTLVAGVLYDFIIDYRDWRWIQTLLFPAYFALNLFKTLALKHHV